MWHLDSYFFYLAALDGSGLVLANLLLGYLAGLDESGLGPTDQALKKG